MWIGLIDKLVDFHDRILPHFLNRIANAGLCPERIQRLGKGGARNMKSMRLPVVAIFFMTNFYRAGGEGAWPPRPPWIRYCVSVILGENSDFLCENNSVTNMPLSRKISRANTRPMISCVTWDWREFPVELWNYCRSMGLIGHAFPTYE